MFDLEQSIAEWRRQMLGAGIQTPVPLEELEEHLRDEIERQMQSGASTQRAFEVAAQHIGQPGALKTEFARAWSFADFIGHDPTTRMNRVLGVLWFTIYAWWFGNGCFTFAKLHMFSIGYSLSLFFALVYTGLFFIGIFASISLFRGRPWGRSRIQWLSVAWLVPAAIQLCSRGTMPPAGYIIIAFVSVSFIQLRLPRSAKSSHV